MRLAITAEAVVMPSGRVGDTMTVKDGRVTGIGTRSTMDLTGHRAVSYDGGYVVPGFRDAHIHAIPYTSLLSGCSLKSATSLDDVRVRLTRFATTLPHETPVVAFRMDDESLAERRLPTRHDLDGAIANRPVVVYRYCGHIAVANTMALQRAGVDVGTPDPAGGTIDRDPHGHPTGVLRETAMTLMTGALGRAVSTSPATVIDGLTRLAGLGITSIGAMVGYGESPAQQLETESALLRSVAEELPLNVHVLSIASSPESLTASTEIVNGAHPRLRWLGVKRFSDGSLGGHTAAMSSPFADSDTVGTFRLTDEDVAVARQSLALGGMVAIHAIGDRAIREVLDVFDTLIVDGANPLDLRMEHVSIADPDLLDRFAASGVIAVVQPAFLASEESWLVKRLGSERIDWAYPFASMRSRGITLAGSSDSTVEPPNPLWGMAAAMNRHGIGDTERLTGLEALELFTVGGAKALRESTPLGIGSPADCVIVDVDLETASSTAVHDASVIDTYVDGTAVEVDRSLPTWMD